MNVFNLFKALCVALLITFVHATAVAQSKYMDETVLISTSLGEIQIKLYKDTPMHGNNFLKLAGQGFYDSTLFHRVIEGFMIQGGDPDSRSAPKGMELGNGGPGYDLEAEILPQYYHVRGALAAAREDDKINPDRASSGSQFYIVHGKTFTEDELIMVEKKQNSLAKQRIFVTIMDKPENLALRNDFFTADAKTDSTHFKHLLDTLNGMIDEQFSKQVPFSIAPERREIYKTIGGAPHLDGSYTIFGEVIKGMEVVDKIAALSKDANDRPLEDISMKVTIIKSKSN